MGKPKYPVPIGIEIAGRPIKAVPGFWRPPGGGAPSTCGVACRERVYATLRRPPIADIRAMVWRGSPAKAARVVKRGAPALFNRWSDRRTGRRQDDVDVLENPRHCPRRAFGASRGPPLYFWGVMSRPALMAARKTGPYGAPCRKRSAW